MLRNVGFYRSVLQFYDDDDDDDDDDDSLTFTLNN